MKKLITAAVAILAILAFTSCAEPSSVLIPVIKVENDNTGDVDSFKLKAGYVPSSRSASRFAGGSQRNLSGGEVDTKYAAVVEVGAASDLHAILVVYLKVPGTDQAVPAEEKDGAVSFTVSPEETYELNAWFFVWDSSNNAVCGMLSDRGLVTIEDATQPVDITIGYDSESGDIRIGIMGYEHSTQLGPVPDVYNGPVENVFGPYYSDLHAGPYTQGINASTTEYVDYVKEGNAALFTFGLDDEKEREIVLRTVKPKEKSGF